MVEMWENVQRACGTSTNRAVSGVELCADELVVGGGVGRSYDRRRRRAAHFSSAVAASDRMREHWNNRWTGVFFSFFSGFWSATSPVISARPLAPKVSCEYPCCTQFHSLNELIVYCLISGGSYRCNVLRVEGTLIARDTDLWNGLNYHTPYFPQQAIALNIIYEDSNNNDLIGCVLKSINWTLWKVFLKHTSRNIESKTSTNMALRPA